MSVNLSPNGRSAAKQPPTHMVDAVSFLRTGVSTPKFGSVNAASTQVDDQGLAEMIVLAMRTLADDFRQRTLAESFHLDSLAPHELLPNVSAAVTTFQELADVAPDDLVGRRRVLTDLASGRMTRLRRQVLQRIEEHIEQAVQPLRIAIGSAIHRAPYAFVQQVDDLLERLRTFELLSPAATAYGRFMKLGRSLVLLDGMSRGLPPHIVERLVQALKQQLDAAYFGAIEEIVRQLLTNRLRAIVAELIPFVEECRRQTKQFIDHLFQVERLLEKRRTNESHAAARSSTNVVLPGPTANELLAALRAERRVGDQLELVRLLAEEYEQSLRQLVALRYPTIASDATLGEMLTRVDPEDLTDTFQQQVTSAVASLHGVYTAIAKQGVADVVRQLLQQSAVLCDLNRRDHVDLGVEPHDLMIVRFPVPVGRDDAAIREELRETFLAAGITCVVREGNSEDRNVSVIQTQGGMPLGLLATNDGLLQDYLDAHEVGHRPHLYGLLSDSPRGAALPHLLKLAKQLRHQKRI
jgi:hypothetical protein